MEEDQNGQGSEPEKKEEAPSFQETPQNGVSFPTVGQPQKSSGAKTLLIIGILILIAILGFVIYKSATSKVAGVSTEPTPFDNLTTGDQGVAISTPAPVATPSTVSKSKVAIQIQNGTGISGEAAFLQTQLGVLGYTNVKVGNATSQGLVNTKVSFSAKLDASVVNELTTKLNALYQKVEVVSSTSTTFDVVIVTGLRKGATPKPSATPVPSASPSASPKPTSTP